MKTSIKSLKGMILSKFRMHRTILNDEVCQIRKKYRYLEF